MDLNCTVGNYCRAVAFSTILRYHEYPFSEAMCFGLGAAFDFSFSEMGFGKSGRKKLYCFSGNNNNDIFYLSDLLCLDLRVLQVATAKEAWELIDQIINGEQLPLIARVAVNEYVRYLNNTMLKNADALKEIFKIISTSVGNHVTIISKIDKAKKRITINEPNMMEPTDLPWRVFQKALNPYTSIISPAANSFYYIRPTIPFDRIERRLPHITAFAIKENMATYLNPKSKQYGISCVEKVRDLLYIRRYRPGNKENFLLFRFFCDVVTGGGFYRRLYGRFLKEANTLYLHNDKIAECASGYGILSRAWSRLARGLLADTLNRDSDNLSQQIEWLIYAEKENALALYEVSKYLLNVL